MSDEPLAREREPIERVRALPAAALDPSGQASHAERPVDIEGQNVTVRSLPRGWRTRTVPSPHRKLATVIDAFPRASLRCKQHDLATLNFCATISALTCCGVIEKEQKEPSHRGHGWGIKCT